MPRHRVPEPVCPVRGGPCSLCVPGVEGPQDCGLVYLMMNDPDLLELRRVQLAEDRMRRTEGLAAWG